MITCVEATNFCAVFGGGIANSTGNFSTQFEIPSGNSVTINCEPGYELNGNEQVTCTSGNYSSLPHMSRCKSLRHEYNSNKYSP